MDHLYKNPSLSGLAHFTPSPSAMFSKLGPFLIHYIHKYDRIPAMDLKMIHYRQCKGGVNYTQFLSISLCQQEFW